MAENALDLAAGASISLGSPSGLDDLASPFTLIQLFRLDAGLVNGQLFLGKNGGTEGWNWWAEDATDLSFARLLSVSNCYYTFRGAGTGLSTATWYYHAVAYDQAGGAAAKAAYFRKTFAAANFAAVGTVDPNAEGSGSITSDAANSIRINDTSWFGGTGGDIDIAMTGMLSGKLSAAQLDAVVANIQGQTWLDLHGKPTANTSFPLITGTAAGIANGTVSGTVALATDAPDWYTGGAAPYDPTLLTRRRSSLLSL